MYASRLPVRDVINWVTEKVTFAAAKTPGRASGFGSFEAMSPPNAGRRISTITIPIKAAFKTEPAIIPAASLPEKGSLFREGRAGYRVGSQVHTARMAFPAITAGNIRGMAAIMGEPDMKKAVTGAMMPIKRPLQSPAASTAIIMVVLTIGPVTYTERFLKNWLRIQTASKRAVCARLLVDNFIKFLLFLVQYKREKIKIQYPVKNLVFFFRVCYNRKMTVSMFGIR